MKNNQGMNNNFSNAESEKTISIKHRQGGESSPDGAQEIALVKIEKDRDLQMREEMNWEHVEDLVEVLKSGEAFPPIILFRDEADTYFVADGWHRILAAEQEKLKTITAFIHAGGREAALLFALGANANHGLRRTNKDKRKAVTTALSLYFERSDRWISEICKVSNKFVSNLRKELFPDAGHLKRIGKDGRVINVPVTSEPQLNFFELLARDFEPVARELEMVCNHVLWVDTQFTKKEKLAGVAAVRDNLKRYDQQLRDLQKNLQEMEE